MLTMNSSMTDTTKALKASIGFHYTSDYRKMESMTILSGVMVII